MKKLLHITLLIISTIVVSSCTKCVTCSDCPVGVSLSTEQVCEDDFNNKEAFDRQVQINEGYGCTCIEE